MSSLRVLVTGGSRGIGRAIALRFAREGARVVVAARSSDQLDQVVQEIERAGGKGLAGQLNVIEFGAVEAAMFRALQFTDGALDVLVNCAGVFDVKPFQRMDIATWERNITVNLNGPFHVTLEALQALEQGTRPHVFMINSVAGRQAFPGNTAYCASKFGLKGFADALRLDLAEQGIRVSSVYPGQTDTTIFDRAPGDGDRSKMNRPEAVAEGVWRAYNGGPEADVDDLDVPPPQ